MADKMKFGDGMEGSTQGQIKSPMNSVNVGNKGGGATHSYKNTMNLNAAGGSGGLKTDGSIMGPGKKGSYPNKGK